MPEVARAFATCLVLMLAACTSASPSPSPSPAPSAPTLTWAPTPIPSASSTARETPTDIAAPSVDASYAPAKTNTPGDGHGLLAPDGGALAVAGAKAFYVYDQQELVIERPAVDKAGGGESDGEAGQGRTVEH